MNRNFRVHFLERLCLSDYSASIRLSSETGRFFLEEFFSRTGDLDVGKLKQYALRFTIPLKHRVEVWKLLLKISSPWPEARQMIDLNRKQEVTKLWSTLKRLLTLHYDKQFPSSPDACLIAKMVLLNSSDSTIYDIQSTSFGPVEHQSILIMSKKMFELASGWEETFWLVSSLHEKLNLDQNVLAALIEETMIGLKGIQERLQDSYETSNSNQQIETCFDLITNRHIGMWFLSAGALWLNDEPLFMLWDKLAASDAVIPLLKSTLYQLFGTIASGSPDMYTHVDPDNLLNRTLSLSVQLQIIKMAIDDVLNKPISTDVPISLTY